MLCHISSALYEYVECVLHALQRVWDVGSHVTVTHHTIPSMSEVNHLDVSLWCISGVGL
jgi:hypothetical protein